MEAKGVTFHIAAFASQVGTAGTGDFFGEKALLTDERRAATVVATSHTVCLTLGRAHFVSMLGPLQNLLLAARERYIEREQV